MCGRDRDACPYLILNPDEKSNRPLLNNLIFEGSSKAGWRFLCWSAIIDWYDERSTTVHGRNTGQPTGTASEVRYWIATQLIDPIIDWLALHRESPIVDLQSELNNLSKPAGWEQKFDRIKKKDWQVLTPNPEGRTP
jgi:hypothetical protein